MGKNDEPTITMPLRQYIEGSVESIKDSVKEIKDDVTALTEVVAGNTKVCNDITWCIKHWQILILGFAASILMVSSGLKVAYETFIEPEPKEKVIITTDINVVIEAIKQGREVNVRGGSMSEKMSGDEHPERTMFKSTTTPNAEQAKAYQKEIKSMNK